MVPDSESFPGDEFDCILTNQTQLKQLGVVII